MLIFYHIISYSPFFILHLKTIFFSSLNYMRVSCRPVCCPFSPKNTLLSMQFLFLFFNESYIIDTFCLKNTYL